MTQFAIVLSAMGAVGFMLIGAAALINPAVLSHLYGTYVHEPNGRAFVRAAGLRDVAFGVLLLAFAIERSGALVVTLSTGALIALGDFFIVLKANKAFERAPLMGHLVGLVFLSAAATFVGMVNLSR